MGPLQQQPPQQIPGGRCVDLPGPFAQRQEVCVLLQLEQLLRLSLLPVASFPLNSIAKTAWGSHQAGKVITPGLISDTRMTLIFKKVYWTSYPALNLFLSRLEASCALTQTLLHCCERILTVLVAKQ